MYYINPSDFIQRFTLFIEDDTRVNLKLFLTNYGNNFDFISSSNTNNGSYDYLNYYFKCSDYQQKSFYTKLPRWFIYHTSEHTLKTIAIKDSLPYKKTFNQIYSMYIVEFIKSYPNNKSIKREYKKFQREYPEYTI